MITPLPILVGLEKIVERGLVNAAFKIWRIQRARGVTALTEESLKSTFSKHPKVRKLKLDIINTVKDSIKPNDPQSKFKKLADEAITASLPHVLIDVLGFQDPSDVRPINRNPLTVIGDETMRKRRNNTKTEESKSTKFNFRGEKKQNSISSPPACGGLNAYTPGPIDIMQDNVAYEAQFNYPVFAAYREIDFGAGLATPLGMLWTDIYAEVVARYGIHTAKTPPTNTAFINLVNYQANLLQAVFLLDEISAIPCDHPISGLRDLRRYVISDAAYQLYRRETIQCFLSNIALPPRVVGLIREMSKITVLTDRNIVAIPFSNTPNVAPAAATNFYSIMSTFYETYIVPNYSTIKEIARLFPEWRGEESLDSLPLRQFMWINGPHNWTNPYPRSNPAGDTLRIYVPEGVTDTAYAGLAWYNLATAQWMPGYNPSPGVADATYYWDGTGVWATVNDGYEARYSRKPQPYDGYTYEYDIEQSIIVSTDQLIQKQGKAARWLWDVCKLTSQSVA